MDKSLIELLAKIGSDKELVSDFSSSLKTGKHLNITGLCNEQKVYVAMALSRLAADEIIYEYAGAWRFSNPFFREWLKTV